MKMKIDRREYVVCGRNTKTGEEDIFLNGMIAAKKLGCSPVLVYNVLNKKPHYLTAKGWQLEWVPFIDIISR